MKKCFLPIISLTISVDPTKYTLKTKEVIKSCTLTILKASKCALITAGKEELFLVNGTI